MDTTLNEMKCRCGNELLFPPPLTQENPVWGSCSRCGEEFLFKSDLAGRLARCVESELQGVKTEAEAAEILRAIAADIENAKIEAEPKSMSFGD